MDLLGSILGSMAAPPSLSEKEKEKRRKEKEMQKKMEESQKKATQVFRTKAEKKIGDFVKNDGLAKLELPPMAKWERALVHDVAETAGLVAHSFGTEDEDRHVVLWKKEHSPDEDELERHKRGLSPEEWTQVKAQQAETSKALAEAKKNEKRKFVPKKGNYQQKYEHLIGKESALEAAKKTEVKKSYGLVSAEAKMDKRTVEDIQAEIRAKKRRKNDDE